MFVYQTVECGECACSSVNKHEEIDLSLSLDSVPTECESENSVESLMAEYFQPETLKMETNNQYF